MITWKSRDKSETVIKGQKDSIFGLIGGSSLGGVKKRPNWIYIMAQ